ncbi:MAG: GNAT family N-acetyltransferase [Rhodocyclaceae bacterium]
MHTTFTIRHVEAHETEVLCHLFRTVFGHPVTPTQWHWKYHDPALHGHINIALLRERRIVGHAGALILPGVHDGRPIHIAQVCDVMLDPRERGIAGPHGAYATFMHGLIAALQARIPHGLYYGFPGQRPFRLGERLGLYRGTGLIHEYRQRIHPSARRPLPALWHRLRPLAWHDPRLDALWQRHAADPGCRLVRDRNYLDWRYARHPRNRYRLLGLYHGFALSGWAVVHPVDDTLQLIDSLHPPSLHPHLLRLLARHAHALRLGQLSWWQGAATAHGAPPGAQAGSTGMVGVVMPSSAPAFASVVPHWQPGDTDVR